MHSFTRTEYRQARKLMTSFCIIRRPFRERQTQSRSRSVEEYTRGASNSISCYLKLDDITDTFTRATPQKVILYFFELLINNAYARQSKKKRLHFSSQDTKTKFNISRWVHRQPTYIHGKKT